jgi:Bacterial TSP3 repeat
MTPLSAGLNIAARDGRITLAEARADVPLLQSFPKMTRGVLKEFYEATERYKDLFEPGAKEVYTSLLAPQLEANDAKGPNLWDRARSVFGHARDTDGDGLSDLDEMSRHTNRFVADTDGDGVADGAEVARGTSPGLAY